MALWIWLKLALISSLLVFISASFYRSSKALASICWVNWRACSCLSFSCFLASSSDFSRCSRALRSSSASYFFSSSNSRDILFLFLIYSAICWSIEARSVAIEFSAVETSSSAATNYYSFSWSNVKPYLEACSTSTRLEVLIVGSGIISGTTS